METPDMQLESVYQHIAREGFQRLTAAFYQQVPQDELLGPMYEKEELKEAEERLCGFLVGRCGGPDDYIQQRGHPRLRMRHAPFAIGQAERDRWVELMGNALEKADISEGAVRVLREFFEQTASFLMNR